MSNTPINNPHTYRQQSESGGPQQSNPIARDTQNRYIFAFDSDDNAIYGEDAHSSPKYYYHQFTKR